MSSPADWKRIEELAEKATPRPWEARDTLDRPLGERGVWSKASVLLAPDVAFTLSTYDSDYIIATANAAPDMAARLRRIAEIMSTKLERERAVGYLSDQTQSAVTLSMAEARELLALLTGEEGEGK